MREMTLGCACGYRGHGGGAGVRTVLTEGILTTGGAGGTGVTSGRDDEAAAGTAGCGDAVHVRHPHRGRQIVRGDALWTSEATSVATTHHWSAQ
jgi:hypothetical protein